MSTPEESTMIDTSEEPIIAVGERDKRTARLMLRMLKDAGSSDSYECEESAQKFTSSPFEARFMGIAAYWSNDMIDLCLTALELKAPEGIVPSNSTTHDEWYKWFCDVVDALPVDIR